MEDYYEKWKNGSLKNTITKYLFYDGQDKKKVDPEKIQKTFLISKNFEQRVLFWLIDNYISGADHSIMV